MSGPKEDLANGAEADAVPSGGSLIGTAESAEMEANVLRFDDDNRNAVILRGGESTKAVHGGERQKGGVKGYATLNALTTPIVQSSTFTFRNTAEILAFNERTESSEYGRYGNPTVRAAEEKILALENAEDCLVSASGMNAVTTMLLALVDSNGHVVLTTDCYRRTLQFVTSVLPKMGVRLTVIDPSDVDELERILQTEGATLFFSEQITNPLCRIIDTERIARLCQQYKCICCIDTTFCTPINHRPIELGADLVLTSGTKYLAGHNDVMCGALSGKRELVDHVRKLYRVLGGAFACMHTLVPHTPRARTPTHTHTHPHAHTPSPPSSVLHKTTQVWWTRMLLLCCCAGSRHCRCGCSSRMRTHRPWPTFLTSTQSLQRCTIPRSHTTATTTSPAARACLPRASAASSPSKSRVTATLGPRFPAPSRLPARASPQTQPCSCPLHPQGYDQQGCELQGCV